MGQPIEPWRYIQVSDSAFAAPVYNLDTADVNKDGRPDLISGNSIYLNPGGNLQGTWEQITPNPELDAIWVESIDRDGQPDVLGWVYPDIYWLEALDPEGIRWSGISVAHLPEQIEPNYIALDKEDGFSEQRDKFVFFTPDNVYTLNLPEQPEEQPWSFSIVEWERGKPDLLTSSMRIIDIDDDGDLDAVGIDYQQGLFLWIHDRFNER